MPPSLSLIQSEAAQLLGRMPESRRRILQEQVVARCEQHWAEIRGSQPLTQLAQTLWSVTPPLADLLLDLYANADPGLFNLLPEQTLTRALALLAFVEIERGNEAAVHLIHEPMMAFEAVSPTQNQLACHSALLRGRIAPPLIHPRDRHGVLWRALAVIAAHTQRLDLPAMLTVIQLLIAPADPRHVLPDAELDALRKSLAAEGLRFLAIEDDHILFAQHEHVHDPVRVRQLGEMLQELRRVWLAS